MKRILCLLLALLMICSLCACGKDAPKDKDTDKGGNTTVADTTTTASDTDGTTTTTAGEDSTTATEASGTTAGTTAGTKAPSTSATKKPTSTTKTEVEDLKIIKILAIGDHAAADIMEKYLFDLLKSAGYIKVQLAVLYDDIVTLDSLYRCIKDNRADFQFRERYNDSDEWITTNNYSPAEALRREWDFVVIQQTMADAGVGSTYLNLDDLTALIRLKSHSYTNIYWNMPWAFRRNSGATGFDNYKHNERVMYESIVYTTLQQVMRDENITGILPTGTAIQNLRTSELRDDLTTHATGHLTDYGAYAAALTWYAILTGESATDVTYRPDAIKKYFAELAEAADNAVNAPNVVTPTAAGGGEYKDLRILSIGHSFSVDAMKTYMWDLFDAAGYNVTIGYLFYPSCSLEQHWHYIKDNSKSYEQYAKNKNGEWVVQSNVDALAALYDEDWDIITFQPDPDFGYDRFLNNVPCKCEWGCGKNIESDYLHFNDMVDLVLKKLASPDNPKGPNTDVKVYYHLTWTWRQDCYLGKYLYPNGYSQLTLYQDFINATKNKVLTNQHIQGVIPCNTAIENARTTWMGDTFNAEGANDGYHLNDKGDLVAALTWVSYFTGVKAADIHYKTSYSNAEWTAIQEAVDNAIANQWEVTQSQYKTKP